MIKNKKDKHSTFNKLILTRIVIELLVVAQLMITTTTPKIEFLLHLHLQYNKQQAINNKLLLYKAKAKTPISILIPINNKIFNNSNSSNRIIQLHKICLFVTEIRLLPPLRQMYLKLEKIIKNQHLLIFLSFLKNLITLTRCFLQNPLYKIFWFHLLIFWMERIRLIVSRAIILITLERLWSFYLMSSFHLECLTNLCLLII